MWSYDNAIAAARFRTYGFDEAAPTVTAGIFDVRHLEVRFPAPARLFAGLTRDAGAFPVQYLGANVSRRGRPARPFGVVVHLVTTLLGLHANARTEVLPARRFPSGCRR
jgi:hypothetical protein